MGARVIAIADSLDAMLSDRPYRRAMSYSEAEAEIENHSGDQFDPDIVNRIGLLKPVIKGLNFFTRRGKLMTHYAHKMVRHSLKKP